LFPNRSETASAEFFALELQHQILQLISTE